MSIYSNMTAPLVIIFLSKVVKIKCNMTGIGNTLCYGALSRLCQGEDVVDPVLQVLGHKPIAGSGQER